MTAYAIIIYDVPTYYVPRLPYRFWNFKYIICFRVIIIPVDLRQNYTTLCLSEIRDKRRSSSDLEELYMNIIYEKPEYEFYGKQKFVCMER